MNEDNDILICRCEEVTKGEILEAIEMGAEDLNEVKLLSRAGMGLCQGRTCRKLVTQIYGERVGKKPEEICPTTYRPPVRPLSMETLASGVKSMDLGIEYEYLGIESMNIPKEGK